MDLDVWKYPQVRDWFNSGADPDPEKFVYRQRPHETGYMLRFDDAWGCLTFIVCAWYIYVRLFVCIDLSSSCMCSILFVCVFVFANLLNLMSTIKRIMSKSRFFKWESNHWDLFWASLLFWYSYLNGQKMVRWQRIVVTMHAIRTSSAAIFEQVWRKKTRSEMRKTEEVS